MSSRPWKFEENKSYKVLASIIWIIRVVGESMWMYDKDVKDMWPQNSHVQQYHILFVHCIILCALIDITSFDYKKQPCKSGKISAAPIKQNQALSQIQAPAYYYHTASALCLWLHSPAGKLTSLVSKYTKPQSATT